MRIPENRRPETSSLLFCPTYASVSISLTFSPEMCPSEPNTLATKPATSTPTTVATIEQSVFADQPPIRYIPTTVTSTTTSTAVQRRRTAVDHRQVQEEYAGERECQAERRERPRATARHAEQNEEQPNERPEHDSAIVVVDRRDQGAILPLVHQDDYFSTPASRTRRSCWNTGSSPRPAGLRTGPTQL